MRIKSLIRVLILGVATGYICYKIGNRNKNMHGLADFRDVMHNIMVPDNTSFVQFTFKPYSGMGYPQYSGNFEITMRDIGRHTIGTSVEVKNVSLTERDFNYFKTNGNNVELGVRHVFSVEELRRRAQDRVRRRNHRQH